MPSRKRNTFSSIINQRGVRGGHELEINSVTFGGGFLLPCLPPLSSSTCFTRPLSRNGAAPVNKLPADIRKAAGGVWMTGMVYDAGTSAQVIWTSKAVLAPWLCVHTPLHPSPKVLSEANPPSLLCSIPPHLSGCLLVSDCPLILPCTGPWAG